MKTFRYSSALFMLFFASSAWGMLCGYPTAWTLPNPTCGAPVIYVACHHRLNGPQYGGELIYNTLNNKLVVRDWIGEEQRRHVMWQYRQDDGTCKYFGR